MKPPSLLLRFQKLLLAKAPLAIKDKHWIYQDRLLFYTLSHRVPWRGQKVSKAFARALMTDAWPLLSLIHQDAGPAPRVGNLTYCPDTAIGDYIWTFQVEVVLGLVELRPEFVAGYRFGLAPAKPYRDACPHHDWPRAAAWDAGYILGIAVHYHPKKVKAWAHWLAL